MQAGIFNNIRKSIKSSLDNAGRETKSFFDDAGKEGEKYVQQLVCSNTNFLSPSKSDLDDIVKKYNTLKKEVLNMPTTNLNEHKAYQKKMEEIIGELRTLYNKVDADWNMKTKKSSGCNYQFMTEKKQPNVQDGNVFKIDDNDWKNVCGDPYKRGDTIPIVGGLYQHNSNNTPLNYLNCRIKHIFNDIDKAGVNSKINISYINLLKEKEKQLRTKIFDGNDGILEKYLKDKKKNKEYNELHLLIDDLKKQKIIEFVYYIGGISTIVLFIINQFTYKK